MRHVSGGALGWPARLHAVPPTALEWCSRRQTGHHTARLHGAAAHRLPCVRERHPAT